MIGNLRLIFTIFSKSYLVLDFFEKIEKTKDQIVFQKKFNYDLNSYIFNYIKIYSKDFESQYYIDFINFFLDNHLKKRIIIFKITKPIGRFGFVLTSYLTTVFYFIKTFLKSILLLINEIDLKKQYNKNYNLVCFGFPSHSFIKHELALSNFSLMEYLKENKNFSNNHKILSIEEYSRPSLNKNSSYYKKLKFYERDFIRRKINFKKALTWPCLFFKILLIFFKKTSKKGIFNFIYFFKNYVRGNFIRETISTLTNKHIQNQNFYFNQFFDLGMLKYENKLHNLNFYNYSQNIFVPPSQKINYNLFVRSNNIDLNNVLGEITFNVFSLYSPHNQINLVSHLNFYNSLIKKINERYKISLPRIRYSNSEKKSNLGYETLKKISLENSYKNIIIFDLPTESVSTTLKRHFTGDLFCSSKYLSEFYNEIIDIVKKSKTRLYIKPKYSIQNKKSNAFYNKIINKLKKNKINYEILNPYEAIIINQKKFDLAINLPYTSTYKTQIEISKKTIFYVPKNYHQYFKELGSRVFNYYDLKQFLKI